jgi:hypothetical protein
MYNTIKMRKNKRVRLLREGAPVADCGHSGADRGGIRAANPNGTQAGAEHGGGIESGTCLIHAAGVSTCGDLDCRNGGAIRGASSEHNQPQTSGGALEVRKLQRIIENIGKGCSGVHCKAAGNAYTGTICGKIVRFLGLGWRSTGKPRNAADSARRGNRGGTKRKKLPGRSADRGGNHGEAGIDAGAVPGDCNAQSGKPSGSGKVLIVPMLPSMLKVSKLNDR